jgi:hypothetical protein
MKIIALRGGMDTGKSHTINIIYQFFLRDNWKQIPEYFLEVGNPQFEDFMDILTKDEIRIGFVGMGDYQRTQASLSNLIKELENKGCNTVICACRNIPAIEKAVSSYPDHIFVDKTPSTGVENNRIVNGIDAEKIHKMI